MIPKPTAAKSFNLNSLKALTSIASKSLTEDWKTSRNAFYQSPNSWIHQLILNLSKIVKWNKDLKDAKWGLFAKFGLVQSVLIFIKSQKQISYN